MKKILITFLCIVSTYSAIAQIIFSVKSPSLIAGTYSFTNNGDGSGWGLANLSNPADAVEDTLMLVDDGSAGLNAQGHPVSAEGCNTLINDLTGKIAVIYRNNCEFGLKALNAQNAGAVAVIVINREPGLMTMGGGVDGSNVTIPVVLISDTDGEILINAMQSEDVVVFIGNKQNYFDNDLGTLAKDVLVAKQFSNPTLLSQNASEYSVDLGLKVRNFGTNDVVGATVTAKISYNGSDIYTQISTPFDLSAADSTIINFPQFSQNSYLSGTYTLSYLINNTLTDKDTSDNIYTSDFIISDTLFSLAPLDNTTKLPLITGGTQPADFTNNYESCIIFQNANASRVKVEGLYFSASTNIEDSLSEQEIIVSAYEIMDEFVNFDDAPSAGNVSVTPLTQGFYNYPVGPQDNMQREIVYQSFDEEIALENDKRYMFCALVSSDKLYIGYNTKLSYEFNVDSLLQPLVPVIKDQSVNLAGFGADNIPAFAVKMSLNDVGLNEINNINIKAYPNPTNSNVTLTFPELGFATICVTDLSGKIVYKTSSNIENSNYNLHLESIEKGMYVVNVVINDKVAKLNIVKQ